MLYAFSDICLLSNNPKVVSFHGVPKLFDICPYFFLNLSFAFTVWLNSSILSSILIVVSAQSILLVRVFTEFFF